MRIPLELFIALRYLRARRSDRFVSFLSLMAIIGIALGVAVLISVLSVMNGFEKEVRGHILEMTAHVTIRDGRGSLEEWEGLATRVGELEQVSGVAPFSSRFVMLNRGGASVGAAIDGVLPELQAQVSALGTKLVAGELNHLRPGERGIVLGTELARELGAGVGDAINVLVPATEVRQGALAQVARFNVVGLFTSGMYTYDRGLAYIHLEDAARLAGVGEGAVTGLRITMAEPTIAPWFARDLTTQLPPRLYVTDWTREHLSYFMALRHQKRMMFVILALIVAVAAFNLLSSLVMTVEEKRGDIAILRTLGASPVQVMTLFMIQGLLIGLGGTVLGVAAGTTLASNLPALVNLVQSAWGVQILSPEIYFLSELPAELRPTDTVAVALTALALALIATLLPARRAAVAAPADVLRHQ